MKKFTTSLLLAFLFLGFSAQAQVVVFSQNKCYSDKMDVVMKTSTEDFGQFLNAQVDAGNLTNWGILTHSWGDEWNFNVYYSAENFTKFQTAFNEAVKNYVEKYPDGFKEFQAACFEHKDSIYNSAFSYPAPAEE